MATDFSEYSDHALEMAIELAEREGATLTVLHVCPMPAYVYASVGGTMAPSPELIAELLRAPTTATRYSARRIDAGPAHRC